MLFRSQDGGAVCGVVTVSEEREREESRESQVLKGIRISPEQPRLELVLEESRILTHELVDASWPRGRSWWSDG